MKTLFPSIKRANFSIYYPTKKKEVWEERLSRAKRAEAMASMLGGVAHAPHTKLYPNDGLTILRKNCSICAVYDALLEDCKEDSREDPYFKKKPENCHERFKSAICNRRKGHKGNHASRYGIVSWRAGAGM